MRVQGFSTKQFLGWKKHWQRHPLKTLILKKLRIRKKVCLLSKPKTLSIRQISIQFRKLR